MGAMRDNNEGMAREADGCDSTSSEVTGVIAHSNLVQLQIDIVSDAICPWCWVAKRQFEAALPTLKQNFIVTTHWHPFQLNPGMPKEGLDRRAYRSAKFGSWEHSQRLDAQVADAGRQAGLEFHHDRMERTPNTFDAHRLIWLAGQTDRQDAVVEGLFRGYFGEGRDIGDRQVLADIADHAGMHCAEILAFLDSTQGTGPVETAEAAAKNAALSGVPTFVVNGQALFSGAFRSDVMIERIRAAVAFSDASPVSAAGGGHQAHTGQ
jgi:predicted DsbA family dithiol-disulfide isomerase